MPLEIVRLLRYIALACGLLFLVIWVGLIADLWCGSGWYFFSNGSVKYGDIYKHYAAGHFAAENDWRDLYGPTQFLDHERKDRALLRSEALAHTPNPPLEKPTRFPKFEDRFYVYPPLVARFAALFTGLNYFIWPNAWCLLSIIFFAAAYSILRTTQPELKLADPIRALFYCAMPAFYVTLWIVQNSTLSLLFIAWAATSLNRGRDIEAAVVLSALFYKPQILLFIFIFMILAGRLRFAFALAAASLLWLLVGIALCGWTAHQLWLSILAGKFHLHRLENYYMGITPLSFYTSLQHDNDAPTWLGPLLTAGGLLITAAAGWLTRNFSAEKNWKPAFGLYLATALWVTLSPVVFFYDWLLTLPWFFVVGATFKNRIDQYLILGAYVILSNSLHLAVTALNGIPPIGPMLCAPWLAWSITLMLREKFPRLSR